MTETPTQSAESRSTVALMYHALTGAGSPEAGQDRHYSISAERFDAQTALLRARAGAVTSARDGLEAGASGAIMTFDDGHLSNYSLAFPILLRQSSRADFFVNPARVGSHGFASWTQLREMAEHGMSIQSHGWDHRYFTELEPSALRDDLVRSRKTIEDRVGQPVTLLAPPGGRMPAGLATLAGECGYRHVLSSRPGRIRDRRAVLLPRLAITGNLGDDTLAGWLTGKGVTKAQLRYAILDVAKKTLGDRGYERMRARLLRRMPTNA